MINKIHKLDDFEKRVYVKTDKTKSVYNDSVNLILKYTPVHKSDEL